MGQAEEQATEEELRKAVIAGGKKRRLHGDIEPTFRYLHISCVLYKRRGEARTSVGPGDIRIRA